MGILSKLKEEEPKEHGWQYKDFEGAVISPSGLRNLFDNPRTWYRNVVLRERTFFGNVNTFFGTLVHKFAEDYYHGTLTKTDSFLSQVEIENICRKEGRNLDEIDYANFKLCCRTLESEYLEIYPKPVEIEGYLEYKPFDDILVAGSFDALEINKDGEMKIEPHANHGYTSLVWKESQEQYYRIAGQLLHEVQFKSERYRIIWQLHSEGFTYQEISNELNLTIKKVRYAIEKMAIQFGLKNGSNKHN